jgi:hypothetical protein
MSLRKLGSFIKIKTMEYSHWVLRKSNAKSMDIDMEFAFLLQSYTEAKSLKKVVKSDGYGGCFPSQPQFYYYSV